MSESYSWVLRLVADVEGVDTATQAIDRFDAAVQGAAENDTASLLRLARALADFPALFERLAASGSQIGDLSGIIDRVRAVSAELMATLAQPTPLVFSGLTSKVQDAIALLERLQATYRQTEAAGAQLGASAGAALGGGAGAPASAIGLDTLNAAHEELAASERAAAQATEQAAAAQTEAAATTRYAFGEGRAYAAQLQSQVDSLAALGLAEGEVRAALRTFSISLDQLTAEQKAQLGIGASGGGGGGKQKYLPDQAAVDALIAQAGGNPAVASRLEAAETAWAAAIERRVIVQNTEYADRDVANQKLLAARASEASAEVRVTQARLAQAQAIEKATAAAEAQGATLSDVRTAANVPEGASAAVEVAYLRQASAEEELAALTQSGVATAKQLRDAQIRSLQAAQGVTRALEADEAQAVEGGGFIQGLLKGLSPGGQGGAFGFGEAATTTLRYVAAYQGFFVLATQLKTAITAAEDYDRSLTNLQVALAGTTTDVASLGSQLAQTGTAAGLSAADAVNAGVQFIRAFPTANPALAGQQGANAAGILNVIGDPKTVTENTQQVMAVLQNFNLGVEGTARVLDVATTAAQHFGQAGPNAILPGLAQISDLAAASGFTLEQTANLIADIQLKTGETSNAAAGELQRFLGREGNNAFQQIFAQYGVDIKQQFSQELAQFSSIFSQLSQSQQAAVIGELGGGRAGTAVEAILADYGRIQAAAEQSAQSGGAAAAQQALRLNDLRGILAQIHGDIQQIGADLGQSGVLNLFGLILEGANLALKGFDDILKVADAIPSGLRQWLVPLAEIAALTALIAKNTDSIGTGKLLNLIPGLGGSVGRHSAAGLATASAEAGLAETGNAGASMGSLIPWVGVAIAGLSAIGLLVQSSHQLSTAQNTAADAVKQYASAASQNDLRNASSAFGTAAAQLPTGLNQLLAGGGPIDQLRQQYEDLKTFTAQQADLIASQQQAGLTSIFGPDGTDLAGGLTYLNRAKLQASDAINLMSQALSGLGAATNQAVQGVMGSAQTLNTLAAAGSATFGATLSAAAQAAKNTVNGRAEARGLIPQQITTAMAPELQKSITTAIEARASQLSIGPSTLLTPDIINQLQAAGDKVIEGLGLSPDVIKSLKTQFDENFQGQFDTLSANIERLTAGGINSGDLTQLFDAKNLYATFVQNQITALGKIPNPLEQATQGQNLLNQVNKVVDAAQQVGTSDQLAQALELQNVAVGSLGSILLTNTKNIVDHIKAYEGDTAKSRQDILKAVTATAVELAKVGDVKGLISLLDGLDKASVAVVRQAVLNEYDAAAAAVASANDAIAQAQALSQQAAAAVNGLEAAHGNVAARAAATEQKAAKDQGAAAVKAIDQAISQAAPSGSYFNFSNAANTAAKKAGELAAAIIDASAISGDPLSQASAALRGAEAKLQDYTKGSLEWYQALKSLHDAQNQYSEEILKLADQRQQLAGDVTDPVTRARDKVLADLNQLRYDQQRGATSSVVGDQLTLKTDQAAAAKAAFDQQMSDMQTNYDLNRISYAAYVNYLESQHNVLSAVKNKTRDQIDELNAVDKALKSVQGQMASQFNIGAIQLPTVYEVRRYLAAQAAGINYQNNQTTTIYINGADTAAVQQVIQDTLGPTSSQVRTVASRKVA